MPDVPRPDPTWWETVAASAGAVGTALLARLLYHRHLVTLGRRHLWSWSLIWELPTAVFSAVVGAGLAAVAGLDGTAALAMVGMISWLGPRGVEDILSRVIAHHYPQRPEKTP